MCVMHGACVAVQLDHLVAFRSRSGRCDNKVHHPCDGFAGDQQESLGALNEALGGTLQDFVDLDGFTGALVRSISHIRAEKLQEAPDTQHGWAGRGFWGRQPLDDLPACDDCRAPRTWHVAAAAAHGPWPQSAWVRRSRRWAWPPAHAAHAANES